MICKYDCVLKFTIYKSAGKDNYIRLASFVLNMGNKDPELYWTPAPIEI